VIQGITHRHHPCKFIVFQSAKYIAVLTGAACVALFLMSTFLASKGGEAMIFLIEPQRLTRVGATIPPARARCSGTRGRKIAMEKHSVASISKRHAY
jgi:hypothetical protein